MDEDIAAGLAKRAASLIAPAPGFSLAPQESTILFGARTASIAAFIRAPACS